MKRFAPAAASLALMVSSLAQADQITVTSKPDALPPVLTLDDVRMVAPALERYTQGPLLGDLWKRPDLSPRDRSIIPAAALIARHQTIEMPYQCNLALDNGVKPSEMSEVITHLAFYSGWANAMSAVAIAKDVCGKRGLGAAQLPPASGARRPIDAAAAVPRAARVEHHGGPVAPGLVPYTSEVLCQDRWRRPALAPRDRRVVTVSALIASGHIAHIPSHLHRARAHGLTPAHASEGLTRWAVYADWPNVVSAVPVVKAVLETRPRVQQGRAAPRPRGGARSSGMAPRSDEPPGALPSM
jgi:4-carboxymuconolactone decarboxylase